MPHRHLVNAPTPSAGAGTPTTPDPEETAPDYKLRLAYQNTFRLEPKQPWVEERVRAVLKEAMHEHLDTAEYDAAKCADLACTVANDVRSRVLQLNFERYKFACIVEISEKLFQGLHTEARFLWDAQRDHSLTYTISNTHIMATGTVVGIYYE